MAHRVGLLAILGILACGGGGEAAPPPSVALVTVDTWRLDHFDARHTPHAWDLARGGWRFTDTLSPLGLTTPAHATLLTGLAPWSHGMRANNHHGSVLIQGTPTLATVAAGAGWETGAFVSAWPAGPQGGLGEGFQRFDAPEAGERPGQVAVEGALGWLRSLPPGRSFFLWVHVFEPHGPYVPPPQDLEAVGGGGSDRARYGGEVHAADRILAPLLDALRERGTLVALAGDHGEILDEERCGFQHERSSSDPVLRVPLVIFGPGVDPQVRDDPAELQDVAPTLLDLAGLPSLPRTDGTSLRMPVERDLRLAESGLCDPACAAGCAPAGILGRDRVVRAQTWRLVDRPGRGRWTEGTGAPLTGWEALLSRLPPATLPEGRTWAQGAALGYLEP